MKKKLISITLIIILCLTLVVTCAACWDDILPITPPNNGANGTDSTKPTDNTGSGTGNTASPTDTDKKPDGDKNTGNTDDKNTSTGNENVGNGGETNKDPNNTNPPTGNENTNKPEDNDDVPFENYGMNVITVDLKKVNVNENGKYNTKEEVAAYIHLYNKLPSNYNNNSSYVKKNYNTQNKLSYGGATFQNREGLLPKAAGRTFVECDIGYTGGQRNKLRIVYSSDGLVFYTSDHYASFSIMRFV